MTSSLCSKETRVQSSLPSLWNASFCLFTRKWNQLVWSQEAKLVNGGFFFILFIFSYLYVSIILEWMPNKPAHGLTVQWCVCSENTKIIFQIHSWWFNNPTLQVSLRSGLRVAVALWVMNTVNVFNIQQTVLALQFKQNKILLFCSARDGLISCWESALSNIHTVDDFPVQQPSHVLSAQQQGSHFNWNV